MFACVLYGLCECQINVGVMFAMYLLIVSCVCVSVCVCLGRGQGTSRALYLLPVDLVTWNKSSVVGRSCDCVSSTLVMWSEHRAGSEKCWVALRGSFYLENRQRVSMQPEKAHLCMDAGRADKKHEAQLKTGRERCRKYSYFCSPWLTQRQPPFFHSPPYLGGFLSSSRRKMQAYILDCVNFFMARQV